MDTVIVFRCENQALYTIDWFPSFIMPKVGERCIFGTHAYLIKEINHLFQRQLFSNKFDAIIHVEMIRE